MTTKILKHFFFFEKYFPKSFDKRSQNRIALIPNCNTLSKSYTIYIKLRLHSKSLKSVTNLKIDDTPFFFKNKQKVKH